MFRFKKKITKDIFYIDWKSHKIKLHVYNENRKDSRVSITKTGIHVRFPVLLPQFEKERLLQRFIAWAKTQLDNKPQLYYQENKQYKNGDIIELYDQSLTLQIGKLNDDKSEAFLHKNILHVNLSSSIRDAFVQKTISTLVYKTLAKHYKAKIWQWLNALNNKHGFGDLKSCKIKNNSSNWGSCSSKGNINISARLFLAPVDVVEYVLIHELAHLSEQNHGSNFWYIVSKACPAYKKHEKWLKEHAKKCVI